MKQNLLALFIACLAVSTCVAKSQPKRPIITRQLVQQHNVGFDTCKVCIEFASEALDELLNAVLNIGVVGECSSLCSYVEQKLNNKIVGVICNILCDFVGVEEFVKIIDKADLDPIYYCELLKSCQIKDDGDASITRFDIKPSSGPQG
jgi:hypothetical protein